MATAYLNSEFRLVRVFDPTEFPFAFSGVDFTPTLVSVTQGGLGVFTDAYSGVFEQAEDGTISGTITGVSGLYYTDAISSYTMRPELLFNVNGLNVDFANFYPNLLIQNEERKPAEDILLGGDDLIYVGENPFGYGNGQIRGYDGDDRLFGAFSTDDLLMGDAGNDTLRGYEGKDTLIGGAGDDLLEGHGGSNRFEGGAGDDRIYAYTGDPFITNGDNADSAPDVAVYQGDSTSYTVTLLAPMFAGSPSVADRVAARDGTDSLFGIEELAFANQSIDLDLLNTAADLSGEEMAELASLYIAYFDRAPDALGLYYWAAHFEDGMALEEISRLFAISQETQGLFPLYGPSEDVVKAVYANVLNRAPEPEGLAFWTEMLTDGAVTRGAFVLEVLRGAAADPAPGESAAVSAQREADMSYLEVKTSLGLYFATERGMSDVENAQDVFAGFDGTTDSIATGKALVDGFYAEASEAVGGELLIQMPSILDDPFYI